MTRNFLSFLNLALLKQCKKYRPEAVFYYILNHSIYFCLSKKPPVLFTKRQE